MAAKAMLSERLLFLLEREIDDFERLADLARAADAHAVAAENSVHAANGGDGPCNDAEGADPRAAGVEGAGDAGSAVKGDAGRRSAGRAKAQSGSAASSKAKVASVTRGSASMPLGSAKERIDALGQLTRTLEKLLDLKRLEKLASEGGQADEAETRRLRAELLSRLKSLDKRRREGATLFVGVDADAVFGGDG